MGKFNTVTFIKTFLAKVVGALSVETILLKNFQPLFSNSGIIRKFKRIFNYAAVYGRKKRHNFPRKVDLKNTGLNFPLFPTLQ